MATALVLSAGGMFGAYQAGVWDGLSEIFDPDIVVGASAGGLNAWHIACGCSSGALANRWLELGDAATIRWRFPRRLSDGCLDVGALEKEIQRMCSTGTPVKRLGVVLTRIPSLQPALFEGEAIRWQHIAGSCAVPFFLRHHQIDGEWYSDGGLIDPLPLNAAIAMGATKIVTVNVLKHRPWAVRKFVKHLRRRSGYRVNRPDHVSIVDVSPDSPLGPLRDAMHWRRESIGAMIERGRRDARNRKDEIVQLSNREIPEFGNLPHPSAA